MTDRRHSTEPPAASFLPPDARAALIRQGESTPEWKPWLGLLETALRHADDDAWRRVDLRFAAARPVDAPLLEGVRALLDRRATDRLVADLVRSALPRDGAPSFDPHPYRLVAAGLRQDVTILGPDGAAQQGAHPGSSAIAHFAVMPLLLEAARRATPAIPPDWGAGYCPVCAGWPTLIEMRGLERRRVLRCGRCATGWGRDVLHCVFCGERDHRRQASLLPDDEAELLHLEVCSACNGYVKVVTTLRPKAPWAIALDDLRTLPLEWTALERGYRRPERPAWTLSAAVAERTDVAAGGAT
jgi:FdhE protein